jgi:CBS domain-containing protein
MAAAANVIQRPLAVMMSRVLRTISPDSTLADCAIQMREAKVGALLVKEGESYVGVVSEGDLVRKAMASCLDPTQERVRRVMNTPVVTIEIHRSAHEASDLMAEHGIRHIAVTDEGQIVGMISVRHLLRYFKNWGGV